MKSIFSRFFLHSALLIFFSFLFLGLIFVVASSTLLAGQRTEAHSKAADAVSELWIEHIRDFKAAEPSLDSSKIPGGVFYREMRILSETLNCRIAIYSQEGTRQFSTGEMPDKVNLPELLITNSPDKKNTNSEIFIPKELLELGFTEPEAETAVASYILGGEKMTSYIFVTSDVEPAKRMLRAFTNVYLFTGLLVLLIASIMAFFNSRMMARPLKEMAVGAQSFGRGDFTARVNRWILRDDEIGELAIAFNSMADELEKSEELQRHFIASISHELRTPMTTIAGFVGGLLDETIPKDRENETLTVVRDEILRLSRLINSMMEVSRVQSGQMEIHTRPMDIVELSTRVLLGLEAKINVKRLQIDVLLPEDDFSVIGDPDALTQVMTNLLDNAVKFADYGGKVMLQIYRKGGRAYIVVQNTGPGIAPEDIPHIFDRFHKGDKSRSLDKTGLGLGLYLVKTILASHNEDIFVKSVGGVTEFMFSLPEK